MAVVQRYELEREPEEEASWGWRFREANGKTITQGESHTRPEDVQRAVNNVAREFTQLTLAALVTAYPGLDQDYRDAFAVLLSYLTDEEAEFDIPIVDV